MEIRRKFRTLPSFSSCFSIVIQRHWILVFSCLLKYLYLVFWSLVLVFLVFWSLWMFCFSEVWIVFLCFMDLVGFVVFWSLDIFLISRSCFVVFWSLCWGSLLCGVTFYSKVRTGDTSWNSPPWSWPCFPELSGSFCIPLHSTTSCSHHLCKTGW